MAVIVLSGDYTLQTLRNMFMSICVKNKVSDSLQLWNQFCEKNNLQGTTVASEAEKHPFGFPPAPSDFYRFK